MPEDPAMAVEETLSGPHWMFYAYLVLVLALEAVLAFVFIQAHRTNPASLLSPNAIIYVGFGGVLIGILVGWWWLAFRPEPTIISFVRQFGSYLREARYVRGGFGEGLYLDFEGGLRLRATLRTLTFRLTLPGNGGSGETGIPGEGGSVARGGRDRFRIQKVTRRFRHGEPTGLGDVSERFGAVPVSVELIRNLFDPRGCWQMTAVFRGKRWWKRGPDLRSMLPRLSDAFRSLSQEMQAAVEQTWARGPA